MRRKFAHRGIAVIGSAATFALLLAGCSGGGSAPDDEEGGEITALTVQTTGVVSDGALILGIEQGFFEEEGLEIKTSIGANPAAGLAAAQSGQVDIAYAPSLPFLKATSGGVAMRAIAAGDGFEDGAGASDDPAQFDDTGIYASPKSGITEIAQLKGKTVAVPARGAQFEVTIAGALKDEGVDPASVKWVVLDFTSAVSALENGTVDVIGVVNPFTKQAEAAGGTLIASPAVTFFEEGSVGLWTSATATIEKKTDAIDGFVRAIEKSNAYANEHPEDAIAKGLEYTGAKLKVEDVKVPYWPTEIRDADLERAATKMADLGFLPQTPDVSKLIYRG